MTFNPRTGEVSLHFNPVMIVADRRHLNDYIPVYGIDQGRLSELLTTIVRADGKELDDGKIGDVYMQLPAWSDMLEKHDLQGWNVWVAYEPSSDLIFLHMDSRTIQSHISTLETDVWELSSLHDGKYRETVMGILANNGFMDASLPD